MITIILFLLSIGMQLAAAIYALLLVRVTGRKTAWIAISIAMVLMAWRRVVSFISILTGDAQVRFDLPEVFAFVISCLLLLGVLRLRNYLLSIHASVAGRKRAEQRLAAQYAVARVLAESSTLAEAAPRLLQVICEDLGWELGELWSVDRNANLLRCAETWHVPSIDASEFIVFCLRTGFAPGVGLPGRVWQNGRPEWIADMVTDPNFSRAAMAAKAGLQSAFAFPVMLGSEILGVMAFFVREMRRPDEELLKMLSTIGSQIGQFIERKQAEQERELLLVRLEQERVRAEARVAELDTLFSSMVAAVVLYAPDGTIIRANEAAERIFSFYKVTKTLPVAERAARFKPVWEDGRPVSSFDQWPSLRALRGETVRDVVMGLLDPQSGQILWLSMNAAPVRDADGRRQGAVLTVNDITDRKHAEEALRESEEKFRNIASSALDAIIMLDHDGRISFWNEAASRIFGFTSEEALGMELSRLIVPQRYHDALRKGYEGFKATGEGLYVGEVYKGEGLKKDGTEIPIEVSISALKVKEQWTAVGILRDVTERAQAEALQDGQKRILEMIATDAPLEDVLTSLVRLIESQSVGMLSSVLLLDDDGVHMRHGAAPSLPEAYWKAVDGASIGPRAGSCGTAMYRRKPVIVTDILRDLLWADYPDLADLAAPLRACWSTPIISHRGAVLGSFAMYYREVKSPGPSEKQLIDIGVNIAGIAIERKRAEAALRKAHTELEQRVIERTKELSEANIKLKELDRLKSLFIASMSHELRTPLNSVIGYSSILMNEWMGPLTEEQKENLSAILRSGKHLLALINDVIDVSKIEAGKVETVVEDFDLSELLSEAAATFARDIKEKVLDLNVESIHQQMHTDRRRLLQCVLNLVSNAVKFTDKGSVSVAARLHTDLIEISVADTGIGIREEDLPKLFQPFMRLVTAPKASIPGTGLGLYLTRRLVTHVLKGDIICISRYGEGSTFTIRIPMRRGE